jgi:hypothetical protein
VAPLCGAQAKLKAVEDKIAALEVQFEEATAKKGQLAQQVLRCTLQLQRADKLIGGLGGEKVRWQVRTVALMRATPRGDRRMRAHRALTIPASAWDVRSQA